MAALAPLRIDGPLPTAPPYGLVTTPGTLIERSDPHWQGGVAVEGYPGDVPSTHDPCSEGTNREKDDGTAPPQAEFSSFTVYLPVHCSGMGAGDGGGFLRDRVRLAFEAVEGYGVELEFAEAVSNTSKPHLADANADPLSGGAVGPREGLALLENAIGATGRNGFIHVDPATFVSLAAYYFVEQTGPIGSYGTMKTRRGNTVIIGNGYIGASPGAAPGADSGWAFATGPVQLTRGEVSVFSLRESLDRSTNDLVFRAERNYVAYWDTVLQASVLIDRSTAP